MMVCVKTTEQERNNEFEKLLNIRISMEKE